MTALDELMVAVYSKDLRGKPISNKKLIRLCARVVGEATGLTTGWIRTAEIDVEQAFEEHGHGWVEKSKPFRKAMLKLANLLEADDNET